MSLNRKDEFHIAEYKALREEILLTIKNQYDMQRAIAIFIAVVFAFAFQMEAVVNNGPSKFVMSLLWLAPFLVTIVGYRANEHSDKSLLVISDYLRQNIEQNFTQIAGVPTVNQIRAYWSAVRRGSGGG